VRWIRTLLRQLPWSTETDMTGYWNEINPKETKEIIQGDTFLNRAQADADLSNQGRYAKEQATTVTGAKAVPSYPRLPSGPWSEGDLGAPDPVTDELGYGINEVEPVLPASSAVTSVGQSPGVGTGAIESIAVAPTNSDAAALSADPGDAVAKGGGRAPLVSSQPSSRKSFRRF
jgi:hypothetical protein